VYSDWYINHLVNENVNSILGMRMMRKDYEQLMEIYYQMLDDDDDGVNYDRDRQISNGENLKKINSRKTIFKIIKRTCWTTN
jgi:hypothetical protein